MYRVKAIKFKTAPRPNFLTINGAICHKDGKPLKAGDIVPGQIFRVDISDLLKQPTRKGIVNVK